MAEVTSGRMTVICLDSMEAAALADLLEVSDPEDNKVLRELTDALVANSDWEETEMRLTPVAAQEEDKWWCLGERH